MASPFQQQSRVRKIIYAGLILMLFTASYPLRHGFIRAQATDLGLRPETKGEVELTDKAVEVMVVVTGSRGWVTCFLWNAAQETKKRNEWNKLEMIVNSVVKLQPYFISPWLFQSWNIAFNVSVECDRIRDKYFFISRGIQLLAEGERRNRGSTNADARPYFPGNPDLRFHMGLYYQLKIGQSDENRTLRSLYQMSCIEPKDRDPDQLEFRGKDLRREINLIEFQKFCEKHPRLVRRLREQLQFDTPRKVVEFLRDNRDIPSRFDDKSERKPPIKKNAKDRFPIMPPEFPTPPTISAQPHDEDDFGGSELGDDFDNFVAARAWYMFAQEPLPKPSADFETPALKDGSGRQYRLPRMSHYLFRQYPALAQQFIADQLAKEGWFGKELVETGEGLDMARPVIDAVNGKWQLIDPKEFEEKIVNTGWKIVNARENQWFQGGVGIESAKEVVPTDPRYSAQNAWEQTYRLFQDYGEKTQLLMPDVKKGPLAEDYKKLTKRAKRFNDAYPNGPQSVNPQSLTGEMAASQRAANILQSLNHYRTITNFATHYHQAEAERQDETVAIRKLYYDATNDWETGKKIQAMAKFNRWLSKWTDLLAENPDFRANREVQEDTYEQQLRYFGKAQRFYGEQIDPAHPEKGGLLKYLFMETAQNGVWVPLPNGRRLALPLAAFLTKSQKDRMVPSKNVRGPFDEGFFDKDVIENVRQRVMYAGQPTPTPPQRPQADMVPAKPRPR
jgi:hypothetical protein